MFDLDIAKLAILIRKQRMELGLGGGGLRHRKNSPNWGGRRKAGDKAPSPADDALEEEYEQEYELGVAERSDRGPVIGVHLVDPKPHLSLAPYGLSSSAKVGNLSAVYEGANDAVRRLSHASIASPGYSRSNPTIFPSTATSTLVALTSNTSLFNTFSSASSSSAFPFNIVKTSPPPLEDLKNRWNDILRLELTEDISAPKGSGDTGKLLKEWDQKVWNKDVPRALKIELTRYFVRDLTTLSKFADAFIVSGKPHISLPQLNSQAEHLRIGV